MHETEARRVAELREVERQFNEVVPGGKGGGNGKPGKDDGKGGGGKVGGKPQLGSKSGGNDGKPGNSENTDEDDPPDMIDALVAA